MDQRWIGPDKYHLPDLWEIAGGHRENHLGLTQSPGNMGFVPHHFDRPDRHRPAGISAGQMFGADANGQRTKGFADLSWSKCA